MKQQKDSLHRRTMLAGAGGVGALAAAAVMLPAVRQDAPPQQPKASPPADTAAGYRLSEHVKRYYATTRV
jgi:hypothetical protein